MRLLYDIGLDDFNRRVEQDRWHLAYQCPTGVLAFWHLADQCPTGVFGIFRQVGEDLCTREERKT